jgi:hypothetical protein
VRFSPVINRVAVCRRMRVAVTLLLVPALFAALGCGGPIIRFGRMPDVSRLETSLKPGISNKADVMTVLGMPRNSGGAMLPGHDSPRDMWVYYYEEGSYTDDRRTFVFVFFKGYYYDGYLWFSSLPGRTRGGRASAVY